MINRRKRRLALIAVAAVLAGILPAGLMLAVTYVQATTAASERLDQYAAVLENHADEIFGTAETVLRTIASTIDRSCSAASVDTLRKAVYNSLYFREAGLIYRSAVQCTSVRVPETSMLINNADLLIWPTTGIHIAAPDLTLEDEVSITVLHGIDRAPGVAVILMLNPRQLLEPARAAIGEQQIALRIERSDGRVLSRAGSLLVSDDDPASLISSRSFKHYPLRAIVAGNRDALIAGWWQNATLFVLLGLGLSLPLFLLLAYADRRERSMDAQLSDALENNELHVHYQPIHETGSLRAVGAEALLRWQHPQRGMILPGVFVPVAEASGLINPLTDWLMRRVAADLESGLADRPDFYITVNLSPAHFSDAELPERVRRIFGKACAARRLVFEVTEREMLSSSDDLARSVIDSLRRDGARVALDDFGTGYSSLRYLGQFHFDLLKIDKAFIDAIGTESITAGLVGDMVTMARRLGLATVAEGVETAEQLDHLRGIGVDYVQGWYLSRALPLDELLAYLAKR
ncbi:MAG: EAL domain-containing protein [Nevskia sp.]|nr:EAL domain-containing protein [Nevskia sp.]